MPQVARRIMYLGYYFKQMDWDKLSSYMKYAAANTGRTKADLWQDMLRSSLKYNISPLEYFYFRFYERPHDERETYAGTGFMYEYQLKMNPPKARNVLNDKLLFLKKFGAFINHDFYSLDELKQNSSLANIVLQKTTGKFVLKARDGQCGLEIKVLNSKDYTPEEVVRMMEREKLDLLEDYLEQHPALSHLSPTGLNTIRIFTQLDSNDELVILGARIRISVDSHVDNLAAGNIAAPIDSETGKIYGAGVYSDPSKEDACTHPRTGVELVGYQIPMWSEIMEMVSRAALANKENRSIGWDVALTENGPELLEGNHNWCKLLWQLPVKRGMKSHLEAFL